MRDPRRYKGPGSYTKEYIAWKNMLARAHSQAESHVKRRKGKIYEILEVDHCFIGKQGFDNFYKEVGVAPSEEHQLDRKCNNVGYIPGNLKWSTPSENSMNRRNSKMITAFGKTQNQADWARETGLSNQLIYQRLKDGASPEEALSLNNSREIE